MNLFIILGVIVLITIAVLGFLFYTFNKEGQEKEKAVPVTDFEQLKKELSSGQISTTAQNFPQERKEEKQPSLEDETHKKRIQELEDELFALSKKTSSQSKKASEMAETLTKENETLKNQLANLELSQKKLLESQGETSDLKNKNISLLTQQEAANEKASILENEITALKVQMGEESRRANETVAELARAKESLLSAFNQESEESMRKEIESLKYELVKAKAQTSGLERVSFNYKNQLEDFLKKVNVMQESNDHLSQIKDKLESMVRDIKTQNEELIKKDQLSQFEIEKNRSRLVNLEREYEDFKARAQQKSK
jgi:DNA repair exonuclease SbcCD ATPase subunit